MDVSLQQYVPLPNRYRVLALRAEAVLTDADAGHEVSFYLQPTLGGAKNLRGYQVWFVSEHVVDTPVGRVDAEAAAAEV